MNDVLRSDKVFMGQAYTLIEPELQGLFHVRLKFRDRAHDKHSVELALHPTSRHITIPMDDFNSDSLSMGQSCKLAF